MYDPLNRGLPKGHAQNWGSGFLPGVYQGTALRPSGQPIPNLVRPQDLPGPQQRAQLDFLKSLNEQHAARHAHDAELEARIESFELAYRMQTAAPEAFDVDAETADTHKLYGLDDDRCKHFARQCLTARRLVERGVRFVQIYSGGMENERSWDGHKDIVKNHGGFAGDTDKPVAALLAYLEQRGLLDETLVIWGGEFGRTIYSQGALTRENYGRDHHPRCFSIWMAGGGIKGGIVHGETDDFSYNVIESPVHIRDLNATILHCLGIDQDRLSVKHQGLDVKLVGVQEPARVVREILA
jgi:uncharacterized protein (DUF1501 family)